MINDNKFQNKSLWNRQTVHIELSITPAENHLVFFMKTNVSGLRRDLFGWAVITINVTS